MELRDGSTVDDARLDRIEHFDARSLQFPASKLGESIKPTLWRPAAWFNQGAEGACAGFAWAHELRMDPVPVPARIWHARGIYYEAQKLDPFAGGEYPGASPRSIGTTILHSAKVLADRGYLAEYRWAFSVEELAAAVTNGGPVVLGIGWYQGMTAPAAGSGRVSVKGKRLGGHAVCCIGVDPTAQTFTLLNNWGRSWGVDGCCVLDWRGMGILLRERGEACVPVRRGIGESALPVG